MAAPFGFSVGDFIAAIELVAKAAEAVQDSGGAASHYQSITRDLVNLQAALLEVDSLQVGNNSPIVGTIYDQTSLARQSAQELLNGITKYENKLGELSKKGWKHGTGRKIQWATLQSKETAKARGVISEQIQNLTLLNMLQILEIAQKIDKSQQELPQKVFAQMEIHKCQLTDSITQSSSVQGARANLPINELKLSLEAFRSTMETDSEANLTQTKFLSDTLQEVQKMIALSSNQFQETIKQEDQGHRADLGQLYEAIGDMRKTISKESESSASRLHLATSDLKNSISSLSETMIESNAQLVRYVAQDLEARITDNFTSAIAQFREKVEPPTVRFTEEFHETANDLDSEPRLEPLLIPINSDPFITSTFLERCLANILKLLYLALRRMQLSLVWLLPLVAGYIAHLTRKIPRQLPRLLENSIRFEDALGRVNVLPYEYFQHWEVFQSMLKCSFKGLPGESNVNDGLYFILRAHRPEQAITQKLWKRSVMPGMNINMSILVAGVSSSESTCPRCKSKDTTKATTIKCQECELEYYSRSMADLEKRQDEIARKLLKLMELGETHRDSDSEFDVEDSTNQRIAKMKPKSSKGSGNSATELRNPKLSHIRVRNDLQDIEVFKRIHTLIEEKRTPIDVESGSDKIGNTSSQEERENINEFWRALGTKERRALVGVEKEAILKKIKEQQRHSCSCTVCTRKRNAIEEELEVLYDAYYLELEVFAEQQLVDYPSTRTVTQPGPGRAQISYDERSNVDEYYADVEGTEYSNSDDDNGSKAESKGKYFFSFGNSITVQGGILAVADDLLKNDGKNFIEMMEKLSERRIAREETVGKLSKPGPSNVFTNPSRKPEEQYTVRSYEELVESNDEIDEHDSEDKYYDPEEMDTMTENQRMKRAVKWFQFLLRECLSNES